MDTEHKLQCFGVIKVIFGDAIHRDAAYVSKTMTIRKFLQYNPIPHNQFDGVLTLNGVIIHENEFDKAFQKFGIKDRCYLLVINKALNV